MGSNLAAQVKAKKCVEKKKVRGRASFCTSLSPELRRRLPATTRPVTSPKRSLQAPE
jgi:hypothetical protein